MRRFISGFALLVWMALLTGCGSEVERTTGTISGSAEWTGTWPAEGKIELVLFDIPPWHPDYEAGGPVSFRYLDQPDSGVLEFSLDKPQIAFGTYGALVIAWQDPEDTNAATRDHPVSVHGTTLDALDQAKAITLDRDDPDAKGLVMPPFELFESAEEMRSNYPSIQ